MAQAHIALEVPKARNPLAARFAALRSTHRERRADARAVRKLMSQREIGRETGARI